MYGLKATIIFCVTAIILFLSNMLFQKYYASPDVWVTNTEKGVYVFDKKTNTLQFCSTEVECTKIDLVKNEVLSVKNNKAEPSKQSKSKKSDIKDTTSKEKDTIDESS
ncbi:MAG: hypothetical protein C0432_05500 [Candidatus Puniceispirillum sp.]|nr:hypothetical protein [Candidatus Pelagibacter sp.]MBA4283729.1 hypothetical protein [Candidatus Puniceispirillum sp.]